MHSLPNRINQIVLKAAAGTLVIIPCGILGYLYTPGLLYGMGSQSLLVTLVAYLILIAFCFGGYTFIRWLFGAPVARCAFGLSCGAVAIACLVLLPFAATMAANFGWYEPPINTGTGNSRSAFGISILAAPAFLVYLTLAVGGWRSRWRSPGAGGDQELAIQGSNDC